MASKYRCMKYEGDDIYSWAVFKASHVKGLKGIVFYGQAQPLVCGCSKNEANHYKKTLEYSAMKAKEQENG